jgi:hypothetical protein
MNKTAKPALERPGRADRSLKGRVKDLGAKGLSIKVIIFAIGTGLLIWGKIDAWTWLALAAVVITGRFVEKRLLRNGEE